MKTMHTLDGLKINATHKTHNCHTYFWEVSINTDNEPIARVLGRTQEDAERKAHLFLCLPELLTQAEISLEREYNSFEPDNQSQRYYKLKEIIEKFKGV